MRTTITDARPASSGSPGSTAAVDVLVVVVVVVVVFVTETDAPAGWSYCRGESKIMEPKPTMFLVSERDCTMSQQIVTVSPITKPASLATCTDVDPEAMTLVEVVEARPVPVLLVRVVVNDTKVPVKVDDVKVYDVEVEPVAIVKVDVCEVFEIVVVGVVVFDAEVFVIVDVDAVLVVIVDV